MAKKPTFRTDEIANSQLPAMILLAKLGWQPLTKVEALVKRGGRLSNVVLEDVLRDYLRQLQVEFYKFTKPLSEENIDKIIADLTDIKPDTYQRQAEAIWDLLVLPISVEQKIGSTTYSGSVRLIDFTNIDANQFHFSAEFSVERERSTETCRPDIVLFVNGIPLAVIENKKAATDVWEGVSQTIRNQKVGYIRHLYTFAQLLLSVNKNDARYATSGTPRKFWNRWRENEIKDAEISRLIKRKLSKSVHEGIFSDEFAAHESFMDIAEEGRLVTEQDRVITGLCRPDRLLMLMKQFILFDGGIKKIARFQQVEAVNRVLDRIHNMKNPGGVIWHTQGSGKSLTMVMMAKAILSHSAMKNARLVVATDRVDLDKQIKGTFKDTGMEPYRAPNGRDLVMALKERRSDVVTTIINKFETAARERVQIDDSKIFVLVDESQRTQYGRYHAQMRRVLPNAVYLGFTGTPVMKNDRNTVERFGGIIHTYTMRDAVEDGAVVPLIYEGRMVEPEMDANAVDTWFDRITAGLNDEQRADLKAKYNRANLLSRVDKVVHGRAYDISEHFRANYQGTGLKAQLVAPDKLTAIKYKQKLDEIGHVTSEVLISAPDKREGHEEVDETKPADEVLDFWQQMMARWGDEEKYNEGVINQFKNSETPEIIIVVDKLLTGFDAPRNAVLYLTRRLRDHTLLQAIARVNRVLDVDSDDFDVSKDFGFIVDYEGILENLDKAITEYDELAGFDGADVAGMVTSIHEELERLPQRHSALWDVFKSLDGSADEEAYEQFLEDIEVREEFYERLTAYRKTLEKAFASEVFYRDTAPADIDRYKRDLKKFENLRRAVKLRFAEEIDFRDYDKKIEKMLHDHISATEIQQVVPPINIFDLSQDLDEALEEFQTDGAKADFIASSTKRTINERMQQNETLFRKLSEMLQSIIDDFKAKRLSEAEYLDKVRGVFEQAYNEADTDAPDDFDGDPASAAYFFYLIARPEISDAENGRLACIDFAKTVRTQFAEGKVVDLFNRPDNLKKIRLGIEDYMWDELPAKFGISLQAEEMDAILEGLFKIARERMD